MRNYTATGAGRKSALAAGLLLVLLFLVPTTAHARDHGIIITGGDPNSQIANWRDSLADEFEKEFKRRSGDTSDVSRADEPSEVESAIKGLKGKVKCGEDIVIYFNGHGTYGKICFFTGTSSDVPQMVKAKDLLKWLREAALPCSCRIHLVIHACYSGQFVEEVAKGDIHVVTAISSATDTRPAHKDVRRTWGGDVKFDGNDWPTGLDEDLDKVPPATDWQPALQEAKKSAKEKMKDKWEDKDRPQTWKRFKGYHVEEVTIDENGVKTIKLKGPDGTERTVKMGPGTKVKVGDEELDYCVVNKCSYVTVLVKESDRGVYYVHQCVASINISGATGHVQGRSGNTFTMHFDAPKHLRCKTREVKVTPGETVPDWVRYCKWVVLDSCYQDSTGITAGEVTEADPPDIQIRGHVQSADHEKGEFEIHISSPGWLRCNTRKVTMKPGERLPAWVKKCKWVKLTGKLTDSITDATGVTETDPQRVNFKGHVREVKDGRATVHVQEPEWLLCEVKVIQPPRGASLPDWVKPCTTVKFQGKLTGDTVVLVSFGMGVYVMGVSAVDIDFEAHVEEVGPDYIVVTIKKPERMAGQQRRLKLKPGQEIPEGVEFCKTITFTGNIIYDSIINGRSIRLAGLPAGTDAGADHIIAPGAEVPAYAMLGPVVEVGNYGSMPIPIPLPVRCFVDSLGVTVYVDTTTIEDLEPGETALAQFREWQAGGPGVEYEVTFATMLPGDENPANDAISQPVLVSAAGIDVGAERIIAPEAEVPAYALLDPVVEVGNHGILPIPNPLPVRCFVDSLGVTVYFDTTTIEDLEPGATALAQFREWQAGGPGVEYEVTFATMLPGDEDPTNDAISQPVLVGEGENQAPKLTEAAVEPPLGPPVQYFTYTVTYTDADGDEPVTHDVLIDGEPRPMLPEGGEPLSGMHFFLETMLEPGVHSFRFLFDDGQGHIVETEELPGPVVEQGE